MTCGIPECGRPGRLLPRGVRCDQHRPPMPTPDPAQSAAAIRTRPNRPRNAAAVPYGTSTTDPLGRDGPLNRNGLPTRITEEKTS